MGPTDIPSVGFSILGVTMKKVSLSLLLGVMQACSLVLSSYQSSSWGPDSLWPSFLFILPGGIPSSWRYSIRTIPNRNHNAVLMVQAYTNGQPLRVGLYRKLSTEELMLLNYDVGEDSWESPGLQEDPNSPSYRRWVLSVHWKDWCWCWNSNTLATWCKELT